MGDLLIRPVTFADVGAINRIYGQSVLTETASWELVPPDEAEMRRRMTALLDGGYPYFVATLDDNLVGYSYASSYRPRPGYRFVVEDSIYVDHASIALHQSLGFSHTVCLPSIGFKFGRWLDSVMMQRALGAGDTTLPEEP